MKRDQFGRQAEFDSALSDVNDLLTAADAEALRADLAEIARTVRPCWADRTPPDTGSWDDVPGVRLSSGPDR